MNSTETMPAPAGGRQVGQLLAGRYRLAMPKGGDDMADVWHALDESTQKVVTLEILRERGNDVARQRFLAEARRMAAIERPSVMRVASILDEATDTFIVFEHLIPLPVVLPEIPSAAKEDRAAPVAQDALAADAALTADEAAPTIVDLDDVREPPVPHLIGVTARLPESLRDATRAVADARLLFRDIRPDTFVVAARALIPKRFEGSALATLVARVTAFTREIVGEVVSAVASAPRATDPDSDGSEVTGAARSNHTDLRARIQSSAAPLIARGRANPVISAAAIGTFVLIVFVVSPLDDAIVSALRGGRATTSATLAPRAATLVPAAFALPPLSAYGATFESQGPYPTTSPNGAVEFVVALRNTGSAGWYRGIDGAQAALATTDGAGVAVQSTEYVAPGQVGWFIVHLRARAEIGTYTVHLLPRIDGRGQLQELGLFTVVTVAKNP